MAAWLTFLPVSAAAFIATSWLWIARWVAHRLATDQFSVARYVIWCLGIVTGVVGLVLLSNDLLFAVVAAALGFWILLGSAVEIRGSERRRRLAVLVLYFAAFFLAQQYLRSRGMILGTRASPAYALALTTQIAGLVLPVAGPLLGKMAAPAWIAPAGIAASIADVVSRHYMLMVALGTLALLAFAVAYLADRPLPAVGLDLLPVPIAWSVLFVLSLLASLLLPRGPVSSIVGLVSVAICPFFVAEAVVLLGRWLSPLRSRHVLLGVLLCSSLALPIVGALFVALGFVARLARLRELLPFAALTETPMRRPLLGGLIWASLGVTGALGATLPFGMHALRRASPKLGAGPEVCASVSSTVDWSRRSVTFTTPDGRFEMDVEETPLPDGVARLEELGSVCAREGKRLCASDEWLVACVCTYPLDAESGTKWWTNQVFAARADQERSAPRLELGVSTLSSEKQSEVRDLLAGRSEVVGGDLGGAALLAGPSDRLADAWSVDCRARAWLPPRALLLAPPGSIGARCCR